ncbi:DUF3857 domain-containing protein [Chryseolinea sp. H1M3-3]|uniref:DUF3857 domain-containing protein n=1 Tax=Chryseolinea sp. H1M3-3 TaxID=3034144 RepID=UPI0023EBCBC5|nr:DUF3857 domain-containing protein [Chryseolinea sp. H1M3-3]
MKFVKLLGVAACCIVATTLFGNAFKPYEWEKERTRYKLSEKDGALSEIILKQHTQYEYVFENNQFVLYSTIHRIIYVNNNEAVQKHNRIVISMGNALDLIDVKARSINKEGKAVYFDKSNLKELADEETGKAFKIFAIEGIEMGSEIEYYFVRKMRPSVFDRVFVQFDVPVKHNSFRLTCPEHLKFDFKTYHNFPEVKEADSDEMNVYETSMTDVPALKTEAFSNFDPNRKRIEFKLAYNTARSDARLYTWDEAAKTFYTMLTEVSKDDQKALDKFVKTLADDPAKNLEDRIRAIENKIKTTIQVNKDGAGESLSQIASILKVKVASHQGMTRLFLGVFDKLKIQCHPVITCSRENIKFDGEFDSWAYLDDYVLYFPETKQFLAPYVFEFRYPLIQPEFTAQKGLFIEPFQIGEVKSALSSIGEIPAVDFSYNSDNLEIEVAFNDDLATNQIRQKRDFGGYNAAYFSPYYDMMSADQRIGMIDQLTKQIAPDAVIKKWTANPVPNSKANNFIVDVNFESSHFMEKAGPRILFKVGELIGPQVEMYRDEQRVSEVENDFNRMYNRIIKIELPKGYQVKNLADLKLNIAYNEKDQTPYLFKSDYVLKDNFLEVHVEEYYKQIYAPLSRYEDFRKVVNAAADFNKITLVLEKK